MNVSLMRWSALLAIAGLSLKFRDLGIFLLILWAIHSEWIIGLED